LSYAALAASNKGKILGPDLFWDTTSKAPEKQGAPEIVRVPNTPDLDIDLDAIYAAIDDSVAMVHICNPNNPTGKILEPEKLRDFCIKASKKALVLVDEAYNELIDEPPKHSMIPLVKAGHNIIVARTFSKIYGLAGMRVGYLIASEENTQWINQYGMGGYTLNQAGLAAAIASYNDEAFITFSKEKIYEAKSMVMDAIKAIGLTALPSSTNFVFVNLGDGNAEYFRQAMAERDVLIRGIYRTYTNWSRVSMGKIADVQRYIDTMPYALDKMTKMQNV
jgi:histidinol-phosphate aminotransferase